jgi:tetratricopeptide (TPR) repeat protein
MRLDEIEDAEAIFELGTSQRPLSPYTHFMLGMSRFKQNNDDLAAKSIDRAIDLKPDYKEALLYRGIIEAQNARYTKALDLFQNAVEIDPEYGAAYYNIAQVHSLKGDKKKAREVYNNGLRAGLAPDLDFEHKIGINKASP